MLLDDEPTGSLDGGSKDGVLALLRHLIARGHTLIVVTHDPEVGARSDRRILLNRGQPA